MSPPIKKNNENYNLVFTVEQGVFVYNTRPI